MPRFAPENRFDQFEALLLHTPRLRVKFSVAGLVTPPLCPIDRNGVIYVGLVDSAFRSQGLS